MKREKRSSFEMEALRQRKKKKTKYYLSPKLTITGFKICWAIVDESSMVILHFEETPLGGNRNVGNLNWLRYRRIKWLLSSRLTIIDSKEIFG